MTLRHKTYRVNVKCDPYTKPWPQRAASLKMPSNKEDSYPEHPHVMVVGAGAVGGFFGALLLQRGVNVTFLVRPATYQILTRQGLSMISEDPHIGRRVLHPPCVQHAEGSQPVDLILLAVKCYDLAPALVAIAPWVHRGAIILTLQNGVGSEAQIQSYFSKDCVVAGVAYITSRQKSPGVIEHFRRGTLAIGERSGKITPRVEWIHHRLEQGGIPCRLSDNIRRIKWEKLCWNATFNPLSVILDHPIGLVLDEPVLCGVVKQCIAEIIAVASAEGVTLDPGIAQETISGSHLFRDFHTSMYEDYKNGKPTEIEALNGDIIKRGQQHGIPTPINEMLYALMIGLEKKRNTLISGPHIV